MNLKPFCSSNATSWGAEPFTRGAFTYATDGYILVRVPRLPDVEETPGRVYEGPPELFKDIPAGEFLDIPAFLEPRPVTCPVCEGKKRFAPCVECGGTGAVSWQNGFNRYAATCKTCDGEGGKPGNGKGAKKCDHCGGAGTVPGTAPVEIRGVFFGSVFLNRLLVLPGVKICPRGKEDPAYFTFDGGDGFLMPRRA